MPALKAEPYTVAKMKPYTVTILRKRVNQTVLAASPDASARIIAGGGIVLQVQERPARKEKRFPLNLFLQELIALLEAGLVVVEAVEALRESSRDGGTSLVLDTLVKSSTKERNSPSDDGATSTVSASAD